MRRMSFWLLVCLLSTLSFAQDASSLLKTADDRVYGPRMKGITDLVVEMTNPKLLEALNGQQSFGEIKELVFRLYWTAQPERVGIELLGFPPGFKEIQEELKGLMLARLENIVPLPLERKFQGYAFRVVNGKTVIAQDKTQQMAVPEFELQLDDEGRLVKIISKKPVGIVTSTLIWEKVNWSEPRSYLSKIITQGEEGPQSTEIVGETIWQQVSGVGVPVAVKSRTKQVLKVQGQGPTERVVEESVQFKNYKLNSGEAMKWFLGNSAPQP